MNYGTESGSSDISDILLDDMEFDPLPSQPLLRTEVSNNTEEGSGREVHSNVPLSGSTNPVDAQTSQVTTSRNLETLGNSVLSHTIEYSTLVQQNPIGFITGSPVAQNVDDLVEESPVPVRRRSNIVRTSENVVELMQAPQPNHDPNIVVLDEENTALTEVIEPAILVDTIHNQSPPPHQPEILQVDTDDEEENNPRPKRRRINNEEDDDDEGSKPGPSKSVPAYVEEEEDDGCTICYEDFTNSGQHRLASLKCGHFFGKSCITRWLRTDAKAAYCPSCKSKAGVKDIRIHFVKAVKVTDTSEIDQLRQINIQLERKVAELELKYAHEHGELMALKDKSKQNQVSNLSVNKRAGKILLIPITKAALSKDPNGAGSKAFAFDGTQFAIGVKGIGNMFCPFAIRTIGWSNRSFQLKEIHPLHSSRTRFIAFSPFESSLVLSGGEDRLAIVHNSMDKRERKRFKMPNDKHVWAGCWLDPRNIVLGCADGRVWQYDLEGETEPVSDLTQGIGNFPIILTTFDVRLGILLIGSFKTLIAIRNNRTFPLITAEPGETIRSFSWDESSLYLMSSCKGPSGFIHRLYKLDADVTDELVTCVLVSVWDNTFACKCSTMWQNCLFTNDKGIFALVFNEDQLRLECYDWSKKRSTVMLSFNKMGNVASMLALPASNSSENFIVILTDRFLCAVEVKIQD